MNWAPMVRASQVTTEASRTIRTFAHEAFQQNPLPRLRGAENQFQPPIFQVRGPLQGERQRQDHDHRWHEGEDEGTQQRGIRVGGGVE